MARAIIFANGEFPDPQGARDLVQADDLVIAADGGTRHALSIGVMPQVVIGDLDSLAKDDRARVEAGGARLVTFSPRKDETDLELALRYAAGEGVSGIIVLAALGGRLDQMVANLLLLALPDLEGIEVRIREGGQEAFLVRGEAVIRGRPGDTVSLLPLGGDAGDVTAEGLEWALHGDLLRFGPARGVSNVLIAERARVRVGRGVLLCVVNHQTNQEG